MLQLSNAFIGWGFSFECSLIHKFSSTQFKFEYYMRSDNWYYTIFSIRGWITVLKVPFSTLVNAIFSFKFKALIKLSLQISWLVISIRLWIQVQEHCYWLSFFWRHLSVCSTANKNQTVSYITEANALNSRISASLFNWHHLHDHEHNWDYLCCVSYGSYQVGCECWDWIYGYLNTKVRRGPVDRDC